MSAMTEDQTYNGWKNYPTWAVNLWLSNDEGLYNATDELVRGIVGAAEVDPNMDEAIDTIGSNRVAVAYALKSWVVDELAPDLGASFAADLLGYAFDCVDWFEIADAWLSNTEEYSA